MKGSQHGAPVTLSRVAGYGTWPRHARKLLGMSGARALNSGYSSVSQGPSHWVRRRVA